MFRGTDLKIWNEEMETLQGERALIRRMRDAEAPRPTLWGVGAVA